jgi:hypothetical protein
MNKLNTVLGALEADYGQLQRYYDPPEDDIIEKDEEMVKKIYYNIEGEINVLNTLKLITTNEYYNYRRRLYTIVDIIKLSYPKMNS